MAAGNPATGGEKNAAGARHSGFYAWPAACSLTDVENVETSRRLTLGMVALAILFFIALGFWPVRPAPPELPATAALRRQNEGLKDILDELDLEAGLLEDAEGRAPGVMRSIVRRLEEELLPRLRAEEEFLFPPIDSHAGGPRDPYTAAMRYEHFLIHHGVEDVSEIASRPVPENDLFRRCLDNLLGLARAHLATEEKVLFPILDRVMSPAQFQKEIGSKMGFEP